MTNSFDTTKHDYLAAARSQMNAEPHTERNPFKAGMARGKASWREQEAARVIKIEIPKTDACPTCAKQISTNTANCLHCGEPLSEGLWQQIMAKQEARSTRKGLFGVGAIALVGLYFYLAPETPVSPEEAVRHRDERIASPAVYPCDDSAKRLLRNSGSFNTRWGFRFRVEGSTATVFRDFTAQNAFGATIDQHYVCTFDLVSKTVTNVEFRGGFTK